MFCKTLVKNICSNRAEVFRINFFRTKMKLTFDPKLKGMTELDKSLFKMKIEVPVIKVKKIDYTRFRKLFRAYTLDSVNLKKYQDLDQSDPLSLTHKYLILDPELFDPEKLDQTLKNEILNEKVEQLPVELDYDDLKFDDVMKAVIPDNLINDNVNVKGYSIIGHIAHFNLRDKVLDFKSIIGEVLLDKVSHIKTVVNKVNEIDNTYRNFAFEILAGEKNTMVTCKENGCEFKFDFANVYWNPRLSTEHERVVNLLNSNDVLYDVFAGVGPFSVPAITNRKLTAVLANDLNPNSYRFLLENYKSNNKSKNKLKEQEQRKNLIKKTHIPEPVLATDNYKFNPLESFTAFNLDGREFIRSKLKYHLIEFLNYRAVNKLDEDNNGKFYALMNLPALSVEFLDSFVNLYDENEIKLIKNTLDQNLIENFYLNVFCYHFCKGDNTVLEAIKERIKKDIFQDENLFVDSKYIRKVAPNKDMYCSMFKLKFQNFFQKQSQTNKNKLNEREDENEREKKIQKVE